MQIFRIPLTGHNDHLTHINVGCFFRYHRGAWDVGGYSKPSGSLWKKYDQTNVKKTEEFAIGNHRQRTFVPFYFLKSFFNLSLILS